MTSYIILVVILSGLSGLSYFLFKKDILSPSFISCSMFGVCAILSIIGMSTWNDEINLEVQTVLIITVGLLSFILGEWTVKKFFVKEDNKKSNIFKNIKINKSKYIFMLIFVVLSITFLVMELVRICRFYGFDSYNISEMLSFYRHKSVLYENVLIKDNMDINFIVKQMHKVCAVICVFNIYIFINNFFYKEENKRNCLFSFIIINLCLIESLLTSGRALLMHYLICILFLSIFFVRKKYKISNLKLAIYSFVFLFLMIILFYFISPLLGRGTTKGIVEYISFYFGTTIPSLNRFLSNLPQHSSFWGEETFPGIYLLLNKLGIIDYTRNSAYGWQMFANGAGSNVYTSLRAYYFDFGLIGVIICQFLFGFVINKLYSSKEKNKLYLIIYSYYFYILIEQIRAEQFFNIISSTTMAYLVLFGVLYIFIFKNNKNKIKNINIPNLSHREIQLEELEILKNVVRYLEDNNLKYSLCAGTLLGAVRHNGFIPWDDDIDIFMPREDYDKFIKICNDKEINKDYVLETIERNNSKYPFAKIVNKKIIIESKSSEDINLWIDIFPIDGYSEDYKEAVMQSKKIEFCKGLIYLNNTAIIDIFKERKSWKNKILKIILKPIALIIPIQIVSKKMIKICKKYKYSESKFVGGYIWGYGICERLEKESFILRTIKMNFEGINFNVPEGYDLYLKSIYGDYMKLPPEEKRITHNIIAKKI
ncbi:MAG: oligosaccharide repeat unit polymerase [Clostridiales bacterium]|nr:oligosaccharide repeat unit polymerase [Clostridiales bacterium]